MGIKDATVQILSDVGKPLKVQELVKRILDNNLWHSGGKTPAASLEAALIMDIKKKGVKSTFVRVAPRTYGLREASAISTAKRLS